ncbi:hypothetical protein K227x_58490 [Rubripirellula lacrimiformis]|uniref:Glycosyltransferase RgtA/B/C/D-like domain-containing protein n=1 Tax=Rubripirellula lacrimiformis TaxID=1930273 RepID=A0A517NJW3_9BACT|nr:glycosyltransferase family 39 protein [Rubripirellula lacrimiformis]QDT07422.1 hypothetical protein K227x_58490 [Rubripirellula lacrimiformis]
MLGNRSRTLVEVVNLTIRPSPTDPNERMMLERFRTSRLLWYRTVAVVCIAVQSIFLIWGAWRNSPTADETGHLVAGVTYCKYWDFDLYNVNPPLPKIIAALPVVLMEPAFDGSSWERSIGARPEGKLGRDFARLNKDRMRQIFFVARTAMLPFAWLGALGCYWLGRRFYGEEAGLFSLVMWCFSPTLLGHGCLVTSDVASASVLIIFICVWDYFRERPCLETAMNLGFALGVAALCKFSLIVLIPAIVIVGVVDAYSRALSTRKSCLYFVVGGVALCLLNFGYLCMGSLEPIGNYQFVSEKLVNVQSHLPHGFLVPLPHDLVEGVDLQAADFERGWHAYLMGETRKGGFATYYLWASLFKVPTTTLVLLGLALFCRWPNRRELPLLVIPLLLILIASKPPTLNIGIRYVIPLLPLAFVLMGRLTLRTPRVKSAAVALMLATVVIVCLQAPNWLGFFSLASRMAGKPELLLADSNIDWGQDLYALSDWWKEREETEPLNLAFWGPVDPELVGIRHQLPPQQRDRAVPINRSHPQMARLTAGTYVISVNFLHAFSPAEWQDKIGFAGADRPSLEYFSRLDPVEKIGTSLFVYELDQVTCDQFNKELGLIGRR